MRRRTRLVRPVRLGSLVARRARAGRPLGAEAGRATDAGRLRLRLDRCGDARAATRLLQFVALEALDGSAGPRSAAECSEPLLALLRALQPARSEHGRAARAQRRPGAGALLR